MSPTADTIERRENVEACTQAVVNIISDFQITVHEMLVGENLVTTESTLSGTHDGEFDEIPPTYETFEVRDMRTFVIEDGKLHKNASTSTNTISSANSDSSTSDCRLSTRRLFQYDGIRVTSNMVVALGTFADGLRKRFTIY